VHFYIPLRGILKYYISKLKERRKQIFCGVYVFCVCAKIFKMSLNQEQRTDNMTFFLDGISWLSLMMDLALLISIAVFQVGLSDFIRCNAKEKTYSVSPFSVRDS
jgi:hypothetical protein